MHASTASGDEWVPVDRGSLSTDDGGRGLPRWGLDGASPLRFWGGCVGRVSRISCGPSPKARCGSTVGSCGYRR